MSLNQAIALKPNLKVHRVKGDGNCLFRSVKYLQGDEESHTALRTAVVAEVQSQKEQYAPFSDNIDEWCSGMLLGGWGDGIACRALCNVVQTPLAIFRVGSSQEPTVFAPTNGSTSGKLCCVELDETSGSGTEHYNPLLQPTPDDTEAPDEEVMRKKKKKVKASKGMRKKLKKTKKEGEASKDMRKKLKKAKKNKGGAGEITDAELPSEVHLPLELDEDSKADAKSPPSSDSQKADAKSPPSSDSQKADAKSPPSSDSQKADAKSVPSSDLTVGCSPIQPGGICAKCNLPVERSNARVTGKKATCWVCKPCNSKASSLYQLFGKWPPQRFQILTKPAQQKFWQDIRAVSGGAALATFVKDTIAKSTIQQTASKKGGQYLPLSVYKQMGYNVKKIRRRCGDKKNHPVFGMTYKVAIEETYDLDLEESKRTQTTGASQGEGDSLFGGPNQLKKSQNGTSPGKAAEDREKIRQAKALATQQARDSKAAQKLARSWLGKFVKLAFNITAILADKSVKKLDDNGAKKDCNLLKPKVDAMRKSLESALSGKAATITAESCKELFDSASDAHSRLLMYQTMKSRVL